MQRRRTRTWKIAAALTVGALFQAVAPAGCLGYLQQNLEVLLRFDAIANSPEMFQSWIWQILGGGA